MGPLNLIFITRSIYNLAIQLFCIKNLRKVNLNNCFFMTMAKNTLFENMDSGKCLYRTILIYRVCFSIFECENDISIEKRKFCQQAR